jgi:hypothetical protein
MGYPNSTGAVLCKRCGQECVGTIHYPAGDGPYCGQCFVSVATPIPMGWLCPRCNCVNAPSVMRCPCSGLPQQTLDQWGETCIQSRDSGVET